MTAQPTRLQQVLIWLAMLVSIGMYYAVAKVASPSDPREDPMMVRILLMIAVGLVGASFLVKSRLAAGTIARLQQMRLVVALVFCEAAALLGLVVWFVTGWHYYYLFMVIGAAGQVLHYPGAQEEL